MTKNKISKTEFDLPDAALSDFWKAFSDRYGRAPGRWDGDSLDPQGTLHVDLNKIQTMEDCDKLRGMRADVIVIHDTQTLPPLHVLKYLDESVLRPITVDIHERQRVQTTVFSPGHPDHDSRCTSEHCVAEMPLWSRNMMLPRQNANERQSFIDQAAIGLFAAGTPLVSVFRKATELWNARCAWLKQQNGG